MVERAKERENKRSRWFWKICFLIATSIVVIIICKMCICKAIFKITSASGTQQAERRAQQARVTSLPVPTLGETEVASPRPTAPPPPSPGIVPTAPQVGIIKANLTKLEGAEVDSDTKGQENPISPRVEESIGITFSEVQSGYPCEQTPCL